MVADRMLHERVRDQNEVPGDPAADCNRDRAAKMSARSESFLAPDQRANERAFEKECEHPFHRQRLANYAASILRKVCPIRSELEFHRNAGDDSDGKIKSEDFRPEPNRLIVFFVTGSKGAPFPVNQKPGQPHGELWKQVVIGDREPEL